MLTAASLDDIRFDDRGLVPVVVQDRTTGEVLMAAWANREALERTLESGDMTFFSRSRNALWRKGETSGNTLRLHELRLDCDGDTLLALVTPAGPACHTGEQSCFFRSLSGCHRQGDATVPGRLLRRLAERRHAPLDESYTARLLAQGPERVAKKLGEEGVETALALALGKRDEMVSEAADLLYHLLVGFLALDMPLEAIWEELEKRTGGHGRPESR